MIMTSFVGIPNLWRASIIDSGEINRRPLPNPEQENQFAFFFECARSSIRRAMNSASAVPAFFLNPNCWPESLNDPCVFQSVQYYCSEQLVPHVQQRYRTEIATFRRRSFLEICFYFCKVPCIWKMMSCPYDIEEFQDPRAQYGTLWTRSLPVFCKMSSAPPICLT